ncbi:hypothetical protein DL766_007060 [Monosporascus sp. MC13-8B]|uniref:Mitochondrial carrier n=1 Tax=Monosporascus cannonballus TaxID=155416 RepID=A0ABY0H524_9PEZI|nr:hypothetical protein DL762_006913 [Monosporascus cannonballus]RYO97177.1 hypothetical protein DL763_002838 [Monosporascus cannonballus]RYP25446.1 hypothetical protein DL766_007060 [Monosporascus sp. MC13-8B]
MSGSSHVDVMLAGAAAAFTVDLMVYPLDTLKTRQQSRDFLKTFADPYAKTKILSRDLFRGLYQGIGIVIVATLPAAGTFFTTYEAAKSFIGRHGSAISLPQPTVHSAASAVAECASCLVLTPAEVIKQNAQMIQRRSATPNGSTSLEALRQLGGAGAWRKLLSGYTALAARNLPFTAIQFPIFEFLRARIWGRRSSATRGRDAHGDFGQRQEESLLETGIVTGTSAGLAGSFAAVVTTPMDVVKTRMMLFARDKQDVKQGSHDRAGYRSKSGLAIAREVVAERGVAGLFRGSLIRAVWTAVGSGLYLGMYEVSKVWLTRGKQADEDSFL